MKILSYDVESCTGRTDDGSLCSFGYVLADENFNILCQEDILINPRPKKFRLGKTNEEPRVKLAYSEEEFRSSPRFSEQYEKISSLFEKDTIVIGFAINNDVAYINDACRYADKKYIRFKFFDVQQIMGFIYPEKKNLGLKTYADMYGIEFIEHRSDEDARVTLLILQKACEHLKLTFKELLTYFDIDFGENGREVKKPIYKAELYEKHGLKKSKATNNILLYEFLEELRSRPKIKGGILRGKRILFNNSMEMDDINFSRSLMKRIYDLSGIYIKDMSGANVYVYDAGNLEDKGYKKAKALKMQGQKITFMERQEFLELIGETEIETFDDVKYLHRHDHNRLVSRLKAKEEKKKALNKTAN